MVTDKAEIVIRNVSPADAADAAGLSAELGYPVAEEAMQKRIADIMTQEDHAVFGAYIDGRLVGWIHVTITQHLQSGRYGEIGGLVVSENFRGCGIGQALVKSAEEWVAGRGLDAILVRSRIARERAHEFYLRQNYSRVKTSAVFSKSLAAGSSNSDD
jgi:GNAT superfamily N-acetyltransferase